MPQCPYFKVERTILRSREIPPAPPQTIHMPWCAHPKHSPVSKSTATRTIGGANHLKCEGDLKKCPLTPAQLVDI
jgi:hypothetical protein